MIAESLTKNSVEETHQAQLCYTAAALAVFAGAAFGRANAVLLAGQRIPDLIHLLAQLPKLWPLLIVRLPAGLDNTLEHIRDLFAKPATHMT